MFLTCSHALTNRAICTKFCQWLGNALAFVRANFHRNTFINKGCRAFEVETVFQKRANF